MKRYKTIIKFYDRISQFNKRDLQI